MSKVSIWKEFSDLSKGEYIEELAWNSDKTVINYKKWKIIFDNYTQYVTAGRKRYEQKYTRVVLPFTSSDEFKFEIYSTTILSFFGKLFGLQDLKIHDSEFDKAFIIKSNDLLKIYLLFENQKLKDLILNLNKMNINFHISDQKGIWEEKLPQNEFELSFYTEGSLNDIETLNTILLTFSILIDKLDELTSIKPIKTI